MFKNLANAFHAITSSSVRYSSVIPKSTNVQICDSLHPQPQSIQTTKQWSEKMKSQNIWVIWQSRHKILKLKAKYNFRDLTSGGQSFYICNLNRLIILFKNAVSGVVSAPLSPMHSNKICDTNIVKLILKMLVNRFCYIPFLRWRVFCQWR